MRPPTQIEPFSLAVNANVFACGQTLNQLGLINFTHVRERFNGIVVAPNFALERVIAINDFSHFLFYGSQVIEGERFVAGEIVIKAVFDGRSNGYLRTRK